MFDFITCKIFCKQAKLDSCAFLCASPAWPVDAVNAPRLCVGQPGSVWSLCGSLNDITVLSAANIPAPQHACGLNVTMSATPVWNQLLHLFLIQSWLAPVSGWVQMITAASPAQPAHRLHKSGVRRLPLVPFAAYYIGKLSEGFGFFCLSVL